MIGKIGVIAALVAVSSIAAARADVLYNVLPGTTRGYDQVIPYGPLGNTFATDATQFLLQDVSLVLRGNAGSPGSISVGVYSNTVGDTPGALVGSVGSISDSDLSNTAAVYSISLATPLLLGADTRYWLEVSSTNDSTATWAVTSYQGGPDDVAGQYVLYNGYVYGNPDPYEMELSGVVPMPEPATIGLLAASALGLASVRRRRGNNRSL